MLEIKLEEVYYNQKILCTYRQNTCIKECLCFQMSAEEAAREAAEEAERQKEEARQKELAAAAAASKPKAKGKGKKSRSPSPKKGGKKEETASTPQPRKYSHIDPSFV